MRRKVITMIETGESAWIPVDYHKHPFSIGLGVVFSDGATGKYTVQHTFDDVQDANVTPYPFDHPDMLDMTDSADANYAHPVSAIRLKVSELSQGGSISLTFIQAGL